ncbi:MAG TPA: NAD(P)-dependent oxidoreductase [Candidatus Obscuribacterales bacterium]
MDKRIVLITGSSGLIGHAVARRLSTKYQIVGFDHEGPPEQIDSDDMFVNLGSDESVQNAFHILRARWGMEIDSVVHLAAYYDFSGAPSKLYDQVTVEGTGRMLRELKDMQCHQFIFSSTMLVHAPSEPGQEISEDWPLKPKWAYPKSKVKTENVILEQHGDIPAVVLRIAGVYDQFCHSIPIAHQIQRIYERRLLGHVFPGDLSHGQSFVHVDDVVDAIVAAVERRDELPRELTALIGEQTTYSYGELQREIGELLYGKDWKTIAMPKSLAKTGATLEEALHLPHDQFIKPWMIDIADDHYELDIARAKQYLGWIPAHDLRETLPAMIEALKIDPLRFYELNKLHIPHWMEAQQRKAA